MMMRIEPSEIIFFVDREARYDNTLITVAFMVSLGLVFNDVRRYINHTNRSLEVSKGVDPVQRHRTRGEREGEHPLISAESSENNIIYFLPRKFQQP